MTPAQKAANEPASFFAERSRSAAQPEHREGLHSETDPMGTKQTGGPTRQPTEKQKKRGQWSEKSDSYSGEQALE